LTITGSFDVISSLCSSTECLSLLSFAVALIEEYEVSPTRSEIAVDCSITSVWLVPEYVPILYTINNPYSNFFVRLGVSDYTCLVKKILSPKIAYNSIRHWDISLMHSHVPLTTQI
jgi:hypothetical protein